MTYLESEIVLVITNVEVRGKKKHVKRNASHIMLCLLQSTTKEGEIVLQIPTNFAFMFFINLYFYEYDHPFDIN